MCFGINSRRQFEETHGNKRSAGKSRNRAESQPLPPSSSLSRRAPPSCRGKPRLRISRYDSHKPRGLSQITWHWQSEWTSRRNRVVWERWTFPNPIFFSRVPLSWDPQYQPSRYVQQKWYLSPSRDRSADLTNTDSKLTPSPVYRQSHGDRITKILQSTVSKYLTQIIQCQELCLLNKSRMVRHVTQNAT